MFKIFALVCWATDQVLGEVVLAELGNLGSTMAVEDSEQGVAISNVELRYVSVLHTAPPTLHLRATKPHLAIFPSVVILFLIRSIVEAG